MKIKLKPGDSTITTPSMGNMGSIDNTNPYHHMTARSISVIHSNFRPNDQVYSKFGVAVHGRVVAKSNDSRNIFCVQDNILDKSILQVDLSNVSNIKNVNKTIKEGDFIWAYGIIHPLNRDYSLLIMKATQCGIISQCRIEPKFLQSEYNGYEQDEVNEYILLRHKITEQIERLLNNCEYIKINDEDPIDLLINGFRGIYKTENNRIHIYKSYYEYKDLMRLVVDIIEHIIDENHLLTKFEYHNKNTDINMKDIQYKYIKDIKQELLLNPILQPTFIINKEKKEFKFDAVELNIFNGKAIDHDKIDEGLPPSVMGFINITNTISLINTIK